MPFPTALEFILEAEQQLAVRFPESFRTHLLQLNGGEVEVADDSWQIHPVFDKSDRKRMARSANHVVHETSRARSWAGFPSLAVTIATNGAGDRLVLLPSTDEPQRLGGAVYRWNHETHQLTLVASDFGKL
jgi:hypothetical protein